MIKKKILLFILLIISSASFSQHCSIISDSSNIERYVIWVIPSKANNIYGLAIGPIGSEAFCYLPYTSYFHGINIQVIGQGCFQTFMIGRFDFNSFSDYEDSLGSTATITRAVHNGILVATFGTRTNQVNGILLSPWMSYNRKVNGLSFNFLWNLQSTLNGIAAGLVNMTAKTNGVQIGLYNRTRKLKGFQIGLWNVNDKRSLPLINWEFNR